MLNKKFVFIAIFLVSLLAMSAVSATDSNSTDEIASGEIPIDDNLESHHDETLSATKTVRPH